ncbi:hypothetical protein SAMN05444162_3408 [Paenibacillaceae bacterium GAS479]|nr:hypothetical protein SAMN05444162_3408 [Paenibacillaceae bacterium GAS479]
MLCPVCNGIRPLELACCYCLEPLVDCGPEQDLADPYSPYGPAASVFTDTPEGERQVEPVCIHRLYCTVCSRSSKASIPLER